MPVNGTEHARRDQHSRKRPEAKRKTQIKTANIRGAVDTVNSETDNY